MISSAGNGFFGSPFGLARTEKKQMLAVGRDGQVVRIIAGQVSPAQTVAIGVERLPPAGLDVSLVAGGRFEHDEAVAECRQRDRPSLELDLPDLSQLPSGSTP